MSLPKSFTQVEGWREDFSAAWRAQDTVRTESLFPELPCEVAGEPVRPLTLRLWAVLDAADNPFVGGGALTVAAAISFLWVQRPQRPVLERWSPAWFIRFRRRCLVWRVAIRERGGVDTVGDVAKFADLAFLDAPAGDGTAGGFNPVRMPSRHFAVSLCAEVMAEFPALSADALLDMPVAQFWQWFHEARQRACARDGREYRHVQPTDRANRRANAKLNQMRREEMAAAKGSADAAMSGDKK